MSNRYDYHRGFLTRRQRIAKRQEVASNVKLTFRKIFLSKRIVFTGDVVVFRMVAPTGETTYRMGFFPTLENDDGERRCVLHGVGMVDIGLSKWAVEAVGAIRENIVSIVQFSEFANISVSGLLAESGEFPVENETDMDYKNLLSKENKERLLEAMFSEHEDCVYIY